MKNKSASLMYLCFSVFFLLYYILLFAQSLNILSFAMSFLALAAVLFLAFRTVRKRPRDDRYVFLEGRPRSVRIAVIVLLCAAAVIGIGNLIFICSPKQEPQQECPYVIVLGGGLRKDDTLSPTGINRIKGGEQYLERYGSSKAVVSGGTGLLNKKSEAEVYAQFLLESGVPSSRIIEEGESRDTIQNFVYSISLIAQNSGVSVDEALGFDIMIVTSRFHLARALRIARRLGFRNVHGIGTRIPVLDVMSCYCREICSYIKLNLRIFLTGRPSSESLELRY